jgi:hypothetical protein
MSERYIYQVCAMQNNRITFVNGEWQGVVGPAGVEPNAALESCPTVWDYLNRSGREGWELVGVLDQPAEGTHIQTLFLKRRL